MAKAIVVYSGYDSRGRGVRVAKREDGVWFCSEYAFNGYANSWSKWGQMDREPTHPTRERCMVEMAGAPDYYEIPVEDQANRISWGFTNLPLQPGPYRVRLPN